jgi:hypothetical protein
VADSTVKVNFLGDASDIERAAEQADDALEKVEKASKDTDDALGKLAKGDPLDKVRDSTEDLDKALKKTKKSSDDVDESLGKVGKTGTSSFKSIAGGILAAGSITQVASGLMDASKAAAEDEAAQVSLAKTLQNVTGATSEQVKGVEDFISKTQNATGVLDDELRPAFDALVRGTGDVAKSQKLMSLAMDISAGTGSDLTSVTDALSKAANGNTKSLKALNPALADLIKDGASTDEIFAALGQTFEGQAAAKANTAAGQMAILKAKMADLQEEVGAKVNVAILAMASFLQDKLIPAVQAIIKWMTDHKEIVIGVAAAIAVGLVVAFISWATAAAAAAAATIAATLPIIAIGVAIAALVAGIIYAYEHWGWFRAAVDAVAQFITDKLVPAFVQIGEFVVDVAKKIAALAQTFAQWVVDVWNFGQQVIDFMESIPGKIADAFANLAEIIVAPFKKGFEEVMSLYDNTLGRIPGLGIGEGNLLAQATAGGNVPGGTGTNSLSVNLNVDGTQVSKAMIDTDRRYN